MAILGALGLFDRSVENLPFNGLAAFTCFPIGPVAQPKSSKVYRQKRAPWGFRIGVGGRRAE